MTLIKSCVRICALIPLFNHRVLVTSMSPLLNRVQISQARERMIVGSILADVATTPLHWIYDQADVAAKVAANGGEAAFYLPMSCPFYKAEVGDMSPYGNEVAPFLRSMGKKGGNLDGSDAGVKTYEHFKGHGGYINHCVKDFLKNRDEGKPIEDCGADDHQVRCTDKLAFDYI